MDGTIVAVGVSAIICVVWTLAAPEKNPDVWTQYKSIELQDDEYVTDPYEEDPAEMDRALKVRLPALWGVQCTRAADKAGFWGHGVGFRGAKDYWSACRHGPRLKMAPSKGY